MTDDSVWNLLFAVLLFGIAATLVIIAILLRDRGGK